MPGTSACHSSDIVLAADQSAFCHKASYRRGSFHPLKSICFLIPLLVIKGNRFHSWTYFLFFSRGRGSPWEVRGEAGNSV